jgi:hypothetical protein
MNDRTMSRIEVEKVQLIDVCNHIREYVFSLAKGNTEKQVTFEQALKDWGGTYFERRRQHKCRQCGGCISLARVDA